MPVEVVAVGTELLLGQVVDTNSAWLGGRLAEAGIDCYVQTKVGDNIARIVAAARLALDRSEAVIVCGGLGPTPDDVTREALAELMGVGQGELGRAAMAIAPTVGTALGFICPVGHAEGEKVVYAVPGVPSEMREMVDRAVVPDLRERLPTRAAIVSRVVRTWGIPESEVADAVAPRHAALEAAGGELTMAFLAAGMDGVLVRLTAKAETREAAAALLDAEEAEVRAVLGRAVFGVDDQSMEQVVGEMLEALGLDLGVAESLTGGLVASRVVEVDGASEWFRGSVVSYDSRVKFEVLGVRPGPVVSEEAARQMAEGATKVLGTSVGLSLTGVAGPEEQEGMPVGTVFVGVCIEGDTEVTRLNLSGDREKIRQRAAVSGIDLLRHRLLGRLG